MNILSSTLVLVTSLSKLGFGLSYKIAGAKPVDPHFLQEGEGWFGGENGNRCALDTNCDSGRCARDLRCADKVENGGGCFENDDCISDICSWGLHPTLGRCGVGVRGEIPFAVTNEELTQEGEEHWWGYDSQESAGEMQYLKNIRYVPGESGNEDDYRVYGTLVSLEEFKSEVEQYVAATDGVDHVLYWIHGVTVAPGVSFNKAHDFNEEYSLETGYLVIPIQWRSLWEVFISDAYPPSRETLAPPAGKQLADKFDMFKLSVPVSLMAHSQGNFVTRVMAQNLANPEEAVFQNIFLVAADTRVDLFSTAFNPEAPADAIGTEGDEVITDMRSTLDEQVYLSDPEDETRENGGYAITQLVVHKVHVVWNFGDYALFSRMGFQIDGVPRRGLGQFGDEAEELTTLQYFKDRVQYHDFSRVIEEALSMEHGYYFDEPTVELYMEYKPDVTTTAITDIVNEGLRVN